MAGINENKGLRGRPKGAKGKKHGIKVRGKFIRFLDTEFPAFFEDYIHLPAEDRVKTYLEVARLNLPRLQAILSEDARKDEQDGPISVTLMLGGPSPDQNTIPVKANERALQPREQALYSRDEEPAEEDTTQPLQQDNREGGNYSVY
jgi:hypothetical protein